MKTPDFALAKRRRWVQLGVCVVIVFAASLQGGCVQARRDGDPFRPVNRVFFHVNMGLDRYIAEPASKVYRAVTPHPVRTGIRNVFTNIASAPTILYDLMQGRPGRMFSDAGRFVINTVWGVGGIFDPATRLGMEHHNESFGITMGVWGVPQGPYFVLPLLGPTTLSNLPDIPVRIFLSPVTYLDSFVRTSTTGMGALSEASDESRSDALERVRNAVEPYEYLRSGYLQHQQELIRQHTHRGEEEDIFPFEALPPDDGADSGDEEKTPEPAPDAGADAPDGDPDQEQPPNTNDPAMRTSSR